MYLKNIVLGNYRNLVNTQLDFSYKINVFTGKNGQGKTNLLESIYFVSLTKSFKTTRLSDIINFNESDFYIQANIIKNNYPYHIDLMFDKNIKHIKINNNNESKFKDVVGLLNAVLFVPEDLLLLRGSPKLRRKMFDIELSKVYPKYLISLSSYYHVLKQRNSYLKSSDIDKLVLETYDSQLAKYGSIIIDFRSKFMVELSYHTNDFYKIISGSQDELLLNYLPSIDININSYIDSLSKTMDRDRFLQQTNLGVHRDDFMVYINEKDAATYASQGEQRTIVLAIKLALVEYIFRQTKEYPILLLDDVMSELDETRQENLLKYLNMKVQTFITTTNIDNLNSSILELSKLFIIENGIVKEARY